VNFKLTLRLLGLLTLILAGSMLLCLPWAWLDRDGPAAAALGGSVLASGLLAGLLLLAGRGSGGEGLGQREGLLVVSGSWVVAGVVGAIPFVLAGVIPHPVDAFFESVSGFTTTGASVLTRMEGVSRALLFWRSLIQWLGGMGIVVLFVAVLPGLGIGGRHLYRQEVPGPAKAGLRPHVRDTAGTLWRIYLGISTAQVLALSLAGMDLFESFCHTFTTMATGGYSTRTASVGAYSPLIQVIVMGFMLAAGVNFSLYAYLWRGGAGWSGSKGLRQMFRDPELRAYLALAAAATLLLMGILVSEGDRTPGEALRLASFQAVSMQTTTGYATDNFDAWPSAARLILVLLMFVGGCAGSTGGSIKVVRYLMMAKLASVQVGRFFRPRRICSVRLGNDVVTPEMLNIVTGFFVIFLATWATVAFALAMLGSDLVTAATASIACLGNVGPGLGGVGPMSNFAGLADPAKIILALAMIAGRLEIYTMVGLLSRSFWRP
jgi:trk system potassium uptake protein TrkH